MSLLFSERRLTALVSCLKCKWVGPNPSKEKPQGGRYDGWCTRCPKCDNDTCEFVYETIPSGLSKLLKRE